MSENNWKVHACAWMLAISASAQAQPAIDSLGRITSEGVVRVGVRSNAPPFASVDASGKPAGFTWEVCKALIKHLEADLKTPLQIKVTPVSLATAFDMLKDGRIDLECGSTTHTSERANQVDFSNTFFVSGIAVAYRKEDVAFANPLKFGRVAVLADSTASRIMAKRFAAKGAAVIEAVVPVKTYDEGVAMLKKNEVDTLFADNTLIPSDPAIDRRRALETVEPYALMLRKGDKAFRDAVDRNLMKVLSGPTVRTFAAAAGLDGKIHILTAEAWRRPSRDPAPQLY